MVSATQNCGCAEPGVRTRSSSVLGQMFLLNMGWIMAVLVVVDNPQQPTGIAAALPTSCSGLREAWTGFLLRLYSPEQERRYKNLPLEKCSLDSEESHWEPLFAIYKNLYHYDNIDGIKIFISCFFYNSSSYLSTQSHLINLVFRNIKSNFNQQLNCFCFIGL